MGISPAALVALLNGDLDNAVTAATPGGIEAQEAAGQAMMVAKTMLPRGILNQGLHYTQLKEKLGIEYHASDDPVLAPVTLPSGWTMRATDHSMHSDVLDEKGRKRLGVFFKAAFYDRNGHVHVEPFYSIGVEYGETRTVTVKAGGKVVHTLGACKAGEYDKYNALCEEARSWLSLHYPDWQDPFAYWN